MFLYPTFLLQRDLICLPDLEAPRQQLHRVMPYTIRKRHMRLLPEINSEVDTVA